MHCLSIHHLSGFSAPSFKEAIEMAKAKGGQLCVLILGTDRRQKHCAPVYVHILNAGGNAKTFYNKHSRKKGSLFCIVPDGFVNAFCAGNNRA